MQWIWFWKRGFPMLKHIFLNFKIGELNIYSCQHRLHWYWYFFMKLGYSDCVHIVKLFLRPESWPLSMYDIRWELPFSLGLLSLGYINRPYMWTRYIYGYSQPFLQLTLFTKYLWEFEMSFFLLGHSIFAVNKIIISLL